MLKIECKAFYEYINKLCKTFKIFNNLENLFDIKIAEYAITSKLRQNFALRYINLCEQLPHFYPYRLDGS